MKTKIYIGGVKFKSSLNPFSATIYSRYTDVVGILCHSPYDDGYFTFSDAIKILKEIKVINLHIQTTGFKSFVNNLKRELPELFI
jgi:hypothetical protein